MYVECNGSEVDIQDLTNWFGCVCSIDLIPGFLSVEQHDLSKGSQIEEATVKGLRMACAACSFRRMQVQW